MKILLIQPPVQDFYDTDIRLQPLGLCMLKAAAKKFLPHMQVTVRDYHQGHGRKTIPLPVWKQSSAEAIPFADATFDAAYCTLSMHHFANLQQSLAEIFRVLRPGGRLVSFTADPRRLDDGFWMPQYFGPLYDNVREVFPSSEQLADDIRKASRSDRVEMRSFPLPHDLEDRFFCSAWRHPERYLDPVFRRGISHF